MTTINFQLSFDQEIDVKKKFNDISQFWEHFFIKNLSDNLLHALDFSENWASNLLEGGDMSQKTFNAHRFSEFREIAKNVTNEIRDTISYEIISKTGSMQEINIRFSINYNAKPSKYCKSIDDYLNDHIIENLIYQTQEMEKLSQEVNNKESARMQKIDMHFLHLLQQMKETLKIEYPKKSMKI